MRKTTILAVSLMAVKVLAGSQTLYLENDLFHDRDCDYTHGTKLTTTLDSGLSFFLWQGIYTPGATRRTDVIEDDRPYAGWLAIGASKQYDFRGFNHVTEASFGVVGPSSLAEQAQSEVHRMIGDYVPRGWDNQLKDEPAVNLRQEIRKAFWLFGDNCVLVPQAETAVGTVTDYAGVGADLMVGFHPDPYPSPHHYISSREKNRWAAYVFSGVRGRYVAWNMLLDGNIWRDSHSVETEPLVGEFYVGLCLSSKRVSLVLTDIVRTREFETQKKPARFGSLAVTFNF